MASTITYPNTLQVTFTAGEGVALTTIKLYEYEIGGSWNEVDDNDGVGLADGGTLTYDLTQDNFYKITITYSTLYKKEFEFIVTDTTEGYVLDVLKKIVCKCNNITREKQGVLYKANKFFMLIATAITYGWRKHGNSTTEYIDMQGATVSQINTRISDWVANCTIDECDSDTCNCL